MIPHHQQMQMAQNAAAGAQQMQQQGQPGQQPPLGGNAPGPDGQQQPPQPQQPLSQHELAQQQAQRVAAQATSAISGLYSRGSEASPCCRSRLIQQQHQMAMGQQMMGPPGSKGQQPQMGQPPQMGVPGVPGGLVPVMKGQVDPATGRIINMGMGRRLLQ